MQTISANITSSTDVIIRSEFEEHSLDKQLIAVNWFDTRIEWLYHLYNYLASRSVLKVGGRPLFKAKTVNDIRSNNGKRSIMLIVQYPDGTAFKQLLESTYFKIVSLLRMRAVKSFTFSFTHAVVKPDFKRKFAHYIIHHFDKSQDISDVVRHV